MIGPIAFAPEVDSDKQPVQPGTRFPAGTKTIYAVFDYGGFKKGDAFEQVWYLDDKETARGSFDWTEAESGSYEGSLNNDQGLLLGNYRLEIRLNGDVLGSGEFAIEQGATPQAAATPTAMAPIAQAPTVEVVTAATFGPISFSEELPDGSAGAATTSFPASIRTIVAMFDYSGMSADSEYTASLYMGNRKVFSQTELWQLARTGPAPPCA